MDTSSGTSTNHDPRINQLLDILHPNLRHNMELFPRPFIVEFDGMPSSGKTTIIKELDAYFRHHGWRVCIPQEGAQVVRHVRSSLAEYNIRTALYAMQMIMDAAWTHTYDLVLIDRGIFDCCCWVEYLREQNLITANEGNTLNMFYLLPFFTEKIDCGVIVVCDPDVASCRKTANQFSDAQGFANPESLRCLHAKSIDIYKTYGPPLYPQLRLLDTTHLTPKEMVRQAADIVLSTLSPGLHNNIRLTPPIPKIIKTA